MEKASIIYGIHAVNEAITSGEPIEKVYFQIGQRGKAGRDLEQLVRRNKLKLSYVPVERLDKLCQGNHQGVAAAIAPISYIDLEALMERTEQSEQPALFLILDQITDVRNFGAIIRTAECVGVHGIIISKGGSAPISGDTVKTSAGAVFKVPICKVDHIKDAIYFLQASGIKIIAATEKADNTIYDIELNDPLAIVMGSEGKGVTTSVLKMVDEQAKLPMLGEIASLNVSVACGALLYEVIRQRL